MKYDKGRTILLLFLNKIFFKNKNYDFFLTLKLKKKKKYITKNNTQEKFLYSLKIYRLIDLQLSLMYTDLRTRQSIYFFAAISSFAP